MKSSITKFFFNRLFIFMFVPVSFFVQKTFGQTVSDGDASDLPKTRTPSYLQWVHRFHVDFGVDYRHVSGVSGNYRFGYLPAGQTEGLNVEKNLKTQDMRFCASSTVSFDLFKNAELHVHSCDNFLQSKSDLYFSQGEFGCRYRANINSKGSPLYVGGSLGCGWNRHYVNLGMLNHSLDKFDAGGTAISSKKLGVYSGFKQISLSPGLSISKSIGKPFEVELFVKYHI